MVARVLKKIKSVFFNEKQIPRLEIDASSTMEALSNTQSIVGSIKGKSKLVIGKNSVIIGKIYLENDSELIVGDNCILTNVTISCKNKSKIWLGEGVLFQSQQPISVNADNGQIVLHPRVQNRADLMARFGGVLTIGEYTDIGDQTEIRCEEQVTIGQFCLFSYSVCIYDTNTHSSDTQYRRKRLLETYPNCTPEIEKPQTKPVLIGDDVWLGKEATITKGVQIGDRSTVGIRTVVGSGIYPEDANIVSEKPRIISKKTR